MGGSVSRDVPNTGFNNGQKVCNIYNSGDCQTINNGKLSVTLSNGEVKVYVPANNAFFLAEEAQQ